MHLPMRARYIFLSLLVPFMVMCGKPATDPTPVNPDPTPVNPDPTPVEPEENPDDLVAPEVKNGDRILVTNKTVETFITSVTYPERDYSYSAMKKGAEADFLFEDVVDAEGVTQKHRLISPGQSDISPSFSIRWPKDTQSQEYTAKLWEGDWSADYTLEADPNPETSFGYWVINNLRPNAHYHFEVKNGATTVTSGEFDTYGHLHQLTFKPGSASGVRNCRDLGGWKTKDGQTVKYRMVYRGGRPEHINKKGIVEARNEGIKAELDLRGVDDHLDASAFEGAEFLSPIIEEGYAQMLRDDKEKTRQCMQFIFDMVDQNKPVYFHCSLGRDRTGTVAMLTLGVLGVDEGEISKEYELTQFAPSGYSISTGETTRMTRLNGVDYDGAAKFIWNYGKQESGDYLPFKDCVEKYLIEIGISAEDIAKFRSNMLE